MRQGALLIGIGALAGLAGGLAVTRFLTGMLYGVSPLEVATWAGVTVLLAGTATVAVLLPARRAARVDPLVAMRAE